MIIFVVTCAPFAVISFVLFTVPNKRCTEYGRERQLVCESCGFTGC